MNHLNVGIVGHENSFAIALIGLFERQGHSAEILMMEEALKRIGEDALYRVIVINEGRGKETLGTPAQSCPTLLDIEARLDLTPLLAEMRQPKEPNHGSSGNDYLAGLEKARILRRPNNRNRHHLRQNR